MDAETQRHIDMSVRVVKAENDARFADVLTRFDVIKSSMEAKPNPPSIWQIAGVVAAGIGAVVAIGAFAYDRFDGGVSASAIVDSAVQRVSADQALRDNAQDKMLDKILTELERVNAQPETSQTGQD